MKLDAKNIDLRSIRIPKRVLDAVPAAFARRMRALPISLEEDVLSVMLPAPADFDTVDKLENLTGFMVAAVPTDDVDALELTIRRCYPKGADGPETAETIFDAVINRAAQMGSSDIHITPTEDGGVVRLRLDGKMFTERKLESALVAELVSFVKVMAGLDISEKRAPMDGGVTLVSEGEEVNLRVATVPTIHGEHVTLRLLSKRMIEGLDNLSDLGMSDTHYRVYLESLKSPNGLVLISGPTGSGKTTTLYASLRMFSEDATKHVVTIEDPVEMPVPGATQIKVDSDEERVSFARALKSVLRHDPDVIMIGEIRDLETADVAVKSALTGHLVFSTLHTNSAAGILTRLVNLGVPAYLVAATINIAVAQRLVRRPCGHCIEWRAPDAREAALMAAAGMDAPEKLPVAKGCSFCAFTGYLGRMGIYEMLPVGEDVKRMILEGASEEDLRGVICEDPSLPTLWEDGVGKVLDGLTTLEEVESVCPLPHAAFPADSAGR